MNTGKKPSIIRIVQVDYVATVGLLFPLVCWGMYLLLDIFSQRVTPLSHGGGLPFLLTMGIVATIAGFVVIFLRVYMIYSIYSNGVEVPGRVMVIDFYRDRGRVEYIYQFMGETYRRSTMVHKTRLTESLQPGMDVVIIVDSSDPKRALICDLYC